MPSIKQIEVQAIPCDSCGGLGTLPGPKTGHQMKRMRKGRGVGFNALLEFFPYKKTYTFDLENDHRPWNNDLVTKYKSAIEKAVEKRLEVVDESRS